MNKLNFSNIIASGPGLNGGKTGEKISIYLAGGVLCEIADRLLYLIDGPIKPDLMINSRTSYGFKNVEASFVPFLPGKYRLSITYDGHQIAKTPFYINITGDAISYNKLVSKVKVIGEASKLGVAHVLNEFIVDCRSIKSYIGALNVYVTGPKPTLSLLEINDNKNGTYSIAYKPASIGLYKIGITIAGEDIPGSPFSINVSAFQ